MPDEKVALFVFFFSFLFLVLRMEEGMRQRSVLEPICAKEKDGAPARSARFPLPSLRKRIISFMPFPFIHQPGPA